MPTEGSSSTGPGEQDSPAALPEGTSNPRRPGSLTELFFAFSALALRGFGGVLPWAQRALVEEKRWLTQEEFVEMLAFGQLFPGPNVVNLSLMVGDRYFGWRGACVALAGMLTFPAVLVLAIAAVYAQVQELPVVRHALDGMGAVAAGLIFGTALKLARAYRSRWRWLGFGGAAFALVGWWRWSLPAALLLLAPVAIGLAWRQLAAFPGGLPGSRPR